MFKRLFSNNTNIPTLRLSGVISTQSGLTSSGLAINNLDKLIEKLFSDKTPNSCRTKIKVDMTVTPIKLRNKKKIIKYNKSFSNALLKLYLMNFHMIFNLRFYL